MIKEFKEFLLKQNALALAIGVIIGAAIGKVVSSIVEDTINPVIGLMLPGGDWRNAKIVLAHGMDAAGKPTESAITYGHLIGSLVDFIIIAAVVYFFVVIPIGKLMDKYKTEPEPAMPTKECPECLSSIPAAAVRCAFCTVEQLEAV